MTARCLLIFSTLLLFANSVCGGGTFQRTKDGKTTVWNNYPERDEEAIWSGARDPDGYATGRGTLGWYRVERRLITGTNIPFARGRATLISRCSGQMVRGKLDGPVVLVNASGKTFHGIFVDGSKTGRWAAGPAPTTDQRATEPQTPDGSLQSVPPPSSLSTPVTPEGSAQETNQPSPKPIDQTQTKGDEEVVRDLPRAFCHAWAKHDGHELAKIMAEDVDFVTVGATWLHGRDDFEKYHARLLSDRFKDSTNTLLDTIVRFLRPGLAIVRWSWTIQGDKNPDGSARPQRSGLMTMLAEKRNGVWLVTAAQNTNAGPGAPEAADIKLPITFPKSETKP